MVTPCMFRLLAFFALGATTFVPEQLPLEDSEADSENERSQGDEDQLDEENLRPADDGFSHETSATKSKRKGDAVINILRRRKEDQAHPQAKVEDICPRTFVYELDELSKSSAPGATLEHVFGEEMRAPGWAGGLYKTKEETLLEILLYRLRVGKRCLQATHPDLADLFLVPILPSADASTWEIHCQKLVDADWQQLLPFLETKTATRHVLIMPEPDKNGRVPCSKFWNHLPTELERATLLAADVPSDENVAALLPPGIKTVPRPSPVHWSMAFGQAHQNAPWIDIKRTRPIFASLFAGVYGPKKFRDLRKHLRVNCDMDAKCEMIMKADGHAVQELQGELPHIMKSKHRSIFCLEPPGTTFARQSLVQSILSGCIPVIFDKEQDNLFPWHWGPWRKGSRVLLEVPEVCYTSFEEEKEECNIVAQLRTLSESRIHMMQRKIAKRAHALQYALGDFDGDAFDITIRELAKFAKNEAERHALTFDAAAQAEDQPLIWT